MHPRYRHLLCETPTHATRVCITPVLIVCLLLGSASTSAAQPKAPPRSLMARTHDDPEAQRGLGDQVWHSLEDSAVRAAQAPVPPTSQSVTRFNTKKALADGLAGAGTVIAGLFVYRGGDDHLNLPGLTSTQEIVGLNMIGVGALLGAKGLNEGLTGSGPTPSVQNVAASAAQSATALRVVRTSVVLEEPRPDAPVLGTVGVGEVLEVLDEREDWYLVRPPDEGRAWRTGWINRSAVEGLEAGLVARPTEMQLQPVPATGSLSSARSTPRFEVAGGYQFMYDSPENEAREAFPAGWFFSGGANLSDSLAVVGEVAGSHKSVTESRVTVNVSVITYLGGLRLRGGSVFVQFLAGGERISFGAGGFSVSVTGFSLQPGFGFDVPVADNVAVRTMVDYRLSFIKPPAIAGLGSDIEAVNQIRAAVGVVVGFGQR